LSDRDRSDADPVRLQINRERTPAVNRMFLIRTLERESLVCVLRFINRSPLWKDQRLRWETMSIGSPVYMRVLCSLRNKDLHSNVSSRG
jgi:hypothetical protein